MDLNNQNIHWITPRFDLKSRCYSATGLMGAVMVVIMVLSRADTVSVVMMLLSILGFGWLHYLRLCQQKIGLIDGYLILYLNEDEYEVVAIQELRYSKQYLLGKRFQMLIGDPFFDPFNRQTLSEQLLPELESKAAYLTRWEMYIEFLSVRYHITRRQALVRSGLGIVLLFILMGGLCLLPELLPGKV